MIAIEVVLGLVGAGSLSMWVAEKYGSSTLKAKVTAAVTKLETTAARAEATVKNDITAVVTEIKKYL